MLIPFSKQEVGAVLPAEWASGKVVSGEGRGRTDSAGPHHSGIKYGRRGTLGPSFIPVEENEVGEGIGSHSYGPYNTGAKDISSKQAFNMVYANEVPSSLDFQSRNARTIQRCYFPFDFPFPRLSHSSACLNLHVVKVCSQVTWGQARKHKPTRGQRMWGYVLAQALTLFLPKREAWAKWLGS